LPARRADVDGGLELVRRGAVRLAIGVGLLLAARLGWQLTGSLVAATALALPGLSLVLHFGLFNLGAGMWRLLGYDARPLFVAPLKATRLEEFWGRRWNLAFSEMTQRAVYGPLSGLVGRRLATAAAFLFSALLHELAISVPVRAGYGLPFAYFLVHGLLVMGEKAMARRETEVARSPWVGRAYVIGALLLPLPALFHPPFLRAVVWPLLGIG
jgi:alginate O-acetyltransferase complex protein AlgI